MSKGLTQETICPVRPGDVVAGKYRVERTLGAGGMGVVVAATQLELDRPVALKFLLPRVLERRDLVARFAREARVAAKLQSEHVARVLDVGALDEDTPFIVMEYLDGDDLSRLIAERGPLPCKVAVGYVLEAAEAVAEAHALGIVHRDIKPANLFLAKRTSGPPLIKVLDFGLSKISELAGAENVTSVTGIFGTPAYMSPEQLWSSRTADARSDIWSLGVVLYELLTAQCPFPHERMPELIAAILHAPVQPFEEWRDDVPPELAAIVLRCMEKEPVQRYANVSLLADALVPYGPPSSERSAERIALMLGSGSSPEAVTELDPRPTPPKRESGGERRASSKPGSGSPVEAAPTLKVVSGQSSVAPVGRPAVGSMSGRTKTAAWALGLLAVASLAAIAGSVVVGANTQQATGTSPSVAAPTTEPAPAPLPSAASTLVEVAPAKSAGDPIPSAIATVVAVPRPAAKEPSKPQKSPAAASAAPSASAAPQKPAHPAPDSSALDPLSRLKPL